MTLQYKLRIRLSRGSNKTLSRPPPYLQDNPFHTHCESFELVYFVEIQPVPKPVLKESRFDIKLTFPINTINRLYNSTLSIIPCSLHACRCSSKWTLHCNCDWVWARFVIPSSFFLRFVRRQLIYDGSQLPLLAAWDPPEVHPIFAPAKLPLTPCVKQERFNSKRRFQPAGPPLSNGFYDRTSKSITYNTNQ